MALAIPLLLPLLLLLLLLLPLLSFFFYARRRPSPKLPPGPTKLPIIGNLHQLSSLSHRCLLELSKKYGPLMYLKLGNVPTIVASSADVAKELLKTHDLDCCNRPSMTSASKLTYGCHDIAFCPYAPLWRELRKIFVNELLGPKSAQLFQSIRQQEVERMIDNIATSASNSSCAVDLSTALLSLSNDITCRAALSKRYHDEEKGLGLHKMVMEMESLVMGFFFADYIPWLGWLDVLTGMRARLERNFRELDGFYDRVIDDHLDLEKRKKELEDGGGEDIIDALLRVQKEATHLTMDHVKAVLMNILFGGSDTAFTVLELTMTELMRNPEVMRKAQSEVRSLASAREKGKVEENDLSGHLPYMKCVVKESMRLHPPAPLLPHREAMRHCSINGFDIPAKTRLIVNAYAIGREAGSWDKDPEVFRPERFIGSTIDVKGHDFQLIPFGAGRRICPGLHVGMAVVELALANLLYSFDWDLPKGVAKEDLHLDGVIGHGVHRQSALHLVPSKYNNIGFAT